MISITQGFVRPVQCYLLFKHNQKKILLYEDKTLKVHTRCRERILSWFFKNETEIKR